MGNFIVSAKLLQGQTPEFRDFFAGFQFFAAAAATFPGSRPLYRHRNAAVDYPGHLSDRGLYVCLVPGG